MMNSLLLLELSLGNKCGSDILIRHTWHFNMILTSSVRLIWSDHVFFHILSPYHVRAKSACHTSIFLSLPREPGAKRSLGFNALRESWSILTICWNSRNRAQTWYAPCPALQQTARSRTLVYVVISRQRAGCREGENVVRNPPYKTSFCWFSYPNFSV